jgi:hypothetical protein
MIRLDQALDQIEGLTISHCIQYFASKPGDPWVEAARMQNMQGELEVPSPTTRSGNAASAGGDYVLAWLWVPDEEAQEKLASAEEWEAWAAERGQ